MRRLSKILAALLALTCATAANATERHDFAVPAGRLGDAVIALGRQGRVSIGITDPALASRRVGGVRGRMTAGQALARLLQSVPARTIALGAGSYRIVAAPPPPRPTPRRRPAPVPAPAAFVPIPEEIAPDIVVTGTRRPVLLSDYPGPVDIIAGDDWMLEQGLAGSEALLMRFPGISSTHLGPGRNKLFLRGVADSSFNGPTQATTGQYLGETRLNYNGPDPDLRLHDIERIEVLYGPQGTLYGAGSLGGIIRIIPNRPRLDAVESRFAAGLSATAHGEPGADLAGTFNLPLIEDRLGLRLALYGASDGGYIDNPLRGESDVNRVTTWGGRASLRLRTPSDWTIDLGATFQSINGADGQFADRDAPPLTRLSPVEQPFSSDYVLADLVVTRDWADVQLVSAFGYVRQELSEQFDSSPDPSQPQIFRQDSSISLLSAETRLSGGESGGFNWVAGVSFLSNDMDQRRRAGPVEAPLTLPGVANGIQEASLFGEASFGLLPAVSLTLGGRVTHSRLSGSSLEQRVMIAQPLAGPSASRNQTVFLPSAAIAWQASEALTLFARYQESFRPGGLAISGDLIRRFRNDDVASFEGGFRWSPAGGTFQLNASAAYTSWRDIQADTISMDGFPTTANIGDGRILSGEVRVAWRPLPALAVEAGLVVNDSRVVDAPAIYLLRTDDQLPNVADLSGHVAADYRFDLGNGQSLRLNGNARYFGRSTLSVGPVLGVEQGEWLDLALGAMWERGRHSVSLTIANLLDEAGNRFALGSPFTLFLNPQVTPMRPRTLRIGYQIRF